MVKRCLIGDELCEGGYNGFWNGSPAVLQMVSIGAGMDSRAFRLNLPEAVFYEVDSEDLFAVKEPLVRDLEPTVKARQVVAGKVGSVGFDLGKALGESGFD